MTENFEDSDHFRLLVTANRFLKGADVLRRSNDYKYPTLFTPTLHLTAHGIEVLLKANLVGADLTLKEVKKYGHDIEELWKHHQNKHLRDKAKQVSCRVWQRAQGDRRWEDNFDDDPANLLEEHIAAIKVLHTVETDYALRYVAESEMTGPTPHLLIDTFLPISDCCLRQPQSLLPPS